MATVASELNVDRRIWGRPAIDIDIKISEAVFHQCLADGVPEGKPLKGDA